MALRAIYIIAEGATEEEFIKTVLRPYFFSKEIYDVRAIKLTTSAGHKGGDLRYSRYKDNIDNLLKSQDGILLTSLIDYYGLKTDFPKYQESRRLPTPVERVSFIEEAIAEDIANSNFLPYIQLHEFEGLLFSSINGFKIIKHLFSDRDWQSLEKLLSENLDPELINGGAQTAPSKRLKALIPTYDKVLHGTQIAQEIGLESIMLKCNRFSKWIKDLERRCNTTNY